jgi:transposase-like protein
MSNHRRKYTKDFKVEIVESILKGASTLEVARENEIYPGLISKWKRQYLDGEFHGTSSSDIELRKLKLKVCELEQMVGKLTMENYLLKKEKDFALQRRKEASSIITGPNSPQSRKDVS